ncbi:MAG: hypothetical protein OXF22_09595 [Anaerolineaceae bacterium]|nr:hypothetical protein [Chloroflexota bacterium]MCY4009988.1 hypothetical protein [Anaerolineaceae bacterium]
MTTLASIGIHPDTTHIGFVDEAYWNERRHRFRSVACVSAKAQDYDEIERRLCNARCEAGAKISEIKWMELTDEERRRDAESVLKAVIEMVAERKVKVDILVWGSSQNGVSREKSLQNRYLSMIQTIALRTWHESARVSDVFWSYKIHAPSDDILQQVKEEWDQRSIVMEQVPSLDIGRAKSALNYMVQVADLFAGMSAYSCEYAREFQNWLDAGQPDEFATRAASWRNRFPFISKFVDHCQITALDLSSIDAMWNEFALLTPDEDSEVVVRLFR